MIHISIKNEQRKRKRKILDRVTCIIRIPNQAKVSIRRYNSRPNLVEYEQRIPKTTDQLNSNCKQNLSMFANYEKNYEFHNLSQNSHQKYRWNSTIGSRSRSEFQNSKNTQSAKNFETKNDSMIKQKPAKFATIQPQFAFHETEQDQTGRSRTKKPIIQRPKPQNSSIYSP